MKCTYFRFSLRFLVGAFTLASVAFVLVGLEVRKQQSLVTLLTNKGVRVSFAEPHGYASIFRQVPAQLFGKQGVYDVVEVEFGNRLITTEDHKAGFFTSKINDSDLKGLDQFPKLWRLNLTGTKVTDAGMEYLRRIQSLSELILDNTRISDNGLDVLSKMQGLRQLSIVNTDVSSAGVRRFRDRLPTCKLRIADTTIYYSEPVQLMDKSLIAPQ
jgi:hypothetical protein